MNIIIKGVWSAARASPPPLSQPLLPVYWRNHRPAVIWTQREQLYETIRQLISVGVSVHLSGCLSTVFQPLSDRPLPTAGREDGRGSAGHGCRRSHLHRTCGPKTLAFKSGKTMKILWLDQWMIPSSSSSPSRSPNTSSIEPERKMKIHYSSYNNQTQERTTNWTHLWDPSSVLKSEKDEDEMYFILY